MSLISSTPSNQLNIVSYAQLTPQQKYQTIEAIVNINQAISTSEDSWESYTDKLMGRIKECPNSHKTLFFAQIADQYVGYAAFYTRQDQIPYPNRFLRDNTQTYCSWIAVDPNYQKQGIAFQLYSKIFDEEFGIKTFKCHIRKENIASVRLIEKFKEQGCETSCEPNKNLPNYLYTVTKVDSLFPK